MYLSVFIQRRADGGSNQPGGLVLLPDGLMAAGEYLTEPTPRLPVVIKLESLPIVEIFLLRKLGDSPRFEEGRGDGLGKRGPVLRRPSPCSLERSHPRKIKGATESIGDNDQ